MRCRLKKKKKHIKKNKLSRVNCWKFENSLARAVFVDVALGGVGFGMGSAALEGFSKLNNSMGASHLSANNIWTGEQHFYTQGPRTAPRGNCFIFTVGENRIIHCTYLRTKTEAGHLKIKKIHSELLSHLLRAAGGIVFYSVLSPPTKKQNSIVNLMNTF